MLDQLFAIQKINTELLALVADMRIELQALQDLVKTTSTDLKELQDRTGVTFDRWRETRKEQNMLYIRDRIKYHRQHGEGLMGANKLACQDLRELHKRELLSK